MDKNFKEQEKTLMDIIKILKKKHKCAVPRCTGFGKTYIAVELIKYYKKVLYIYPAEVIKQTAEKRYIQLVEDNKTEVEDDDIIDIETIRTKELLSIIPNCDMLTYYKLARMKPDQINQLINEKYDLVIFDEAHRMGSEKAKINIERLLSAINADYVGLTATPIRTDGMDIISTFFNNNMCYAYSILDAIDNGIIKVPNYIYCYDSDNKYSEKMKETGLTVAKEIGDDPIRSTVFKSRIIEAAKLNEKKMHEIIKENCNKFIDTDYMKFIVFFSSINQMDNKLKVVKRWFHKAFPDHKIEILRITSKNIEETKNTKKLEKLVSEHNVIHLIACINMINMGYHVDTLSGIIMYRGTSSNIIYTQQFGRALSSGSDKASLVFDVVDNLHRKAIFDLRPSYCKRKNNKYLTSYELDEFNNVVLYDPDNKIFIKTKYSMNEFGEIVDENNDITGFEYDSKTDKIYEIGDPRKDRTKNPNMITKECLNLSSNQATKREIAAKIEGEILSQKCHWVLETHFRTWCYNNGIMYPISKAELKEFYGKDKKEFYDWFVNLLKEKKLDYPFYDIEKLLYIGTEKDDLNTSLKVCCAIKNISVSQVLDILGVA